MSRLTTILIVFALSLLAFAAKAVAQNETHTLAMKGGETVELFPVYGISNCRSTLLATPTVEVLEGPPELTLSIKEGMVKPRKAGCTDKVKGGTVVATAKDVKAPIQAKLTFRIKYKGKDGDRQTGHVYNVSLFPR